MKTCSNCGYPIEEVGFDPENPAETLGELFHKSVSPADDKDLCQTCKEELGMLNILGFGE